MIIKTIRFLGLYSVFMLAAVSPALADQASLPDDHAPIGVMGDHNHKQGEWMTAYRYSGMQMKDHRNGTRNISTDEVLDDFMVAPLKMNMDMHMFGAMYGATDKLTLMGMLPYVQKSMTSVNRMGVKFKTKTEGLSDIKLNGLYTLFESETDAVTHRTRQKLLLRLGVSLPTGSITERDDTPAGSNQKLPYPMQLGSGTVDPLMGLTYIHKRQDWSWGAQGNLVLRIGENDQGYRLGNEISATGWVARNLNRHTSLSVRLEGKSWGDIHGEDDDLNPMMAAGARTDLRGGERVDALVGLNLTAPQGQLTGHRLAAEFGMPVYQNFDGPQLETDYRLTLGWQWAF
ncbi:MAG: transporter [Pseudomonadota bacterium]